MRSSDLSLPDPDSFACVNDVNLDCRGRGHRHEIFVPQLVNHINAQKLALEFCRWTTRERRHADKYEVVLVWPDIFGTDQLFYHSSPSLAADALSSAPQIEEYCRAIRPVLNNSVRDRVDNVGLFPFVISIPKRGPRG